MGNTENHNWTTPDQDSSTYPQDFESFFEDADTDVPIIDKEDNLGDYTPKVDAKFYAKDTGKTFVGDGTNWNQKSNVESISSQSNLSDNEPGFYIFEDTGQLAYFDGDTSTN